MERESIMQRVVAILQEILILDDRPIGPEDRFFADLGGESIDLLELEFKIQRVFGVTISFSKLLSGGDIQPAPDGRIKPDAVRELAERFPFLPLHRLPTEPRPADMLDLLTVATITSLVEMSLRASDAGGAARPLPA